MTAREQLQKYAEMQSAVEATQEQIAALKQSDEVAVFYKQLDLLKRRLLADPSSFREMFIAEGMDAIAWEFQQEELGAAFTRTFWGLLAAGGDMGTLLQRFVWELPLKFKRKFIRAIDQHLSDRYPMFQGLSEGWPGDSNIPPYMRTPEERSSDFGLVNQGYLGYTNLGYSVREADLLVWLEVLRDKQCDDRPCEIGIPIEGKSEPKGGCPVKIHIPEMLELLGTGRYREALELIEGCNPLPNVTGRVCPQELQCQGVCTLNNRPIEIGQLETQTESAIRWEFPIGIRDDQIWNSDTIPSFPHLVRRAND